MDNLIQRIKMARSKLGLTQSELSHITGISQTSIARYETGDATPRQTTLVKLAKAFAVDYEWLANGTGNPTRNYIVVPLITWFEAGQIGKEPPIPEEYIPFPYNDSDEKHCFALRIMGDSMVPKFEPGDIICVDMGKPLRNGGYAIYRHEIEHEATFNKIAIEGNNYMLIPENNVYPLSHCVKSSIFYIGTVVYCLKRV